MLARAHRGYVMTDNPVLPQGYLLRPGDPRDIPSLQAVDLAASALFSPTGLIDEGPAGPQPIPAYALEAGCETGLLYVMDGPGNAPCGFALGRIMAPDLYLDQISVDPVHGRRGLGAALLWKVIAEADRRKLCGVSLSTFRDLAWNGPFYASHGFRELPRQRMKGWMRQLEQIQSETMDVSLRCFMRRPGMWQGRPLSRRLARLQT